MEIEQAFAILANTIKELEQIKPRGTGIRVEHSEDIVIEDIVFSGLEKAIDISNSKDIKLKRNIINNYAKYSELPTLLEQFLVEANKKKTQVNKSALVRIKNDVSKRWPELVGTTLIIAMIRIIAIFM